jgi:hypothetical protein
MLIFVSWKVCAFPGDSPQTALRKRVDGSKMLSCRVAGQKKEETEETFVHLTFLQIDKIWTHNYERRNFSLILSRDMLTDDGYADRR